MSESIINQSMPSSSTRMTDTEELDDIPVASPSTEAQNTCVAEKWAIFDQYIAIAQTHISQKI